MSDFVNPVIGDAETDILQSLSEMAGSTDAEVSNVLWHALAHFARRIGDRDQRQNVAAMLEHLAGQLRAEPSDQDRDEKPYWTKERIEQARRDSIRLIRQRD